MGWFDDNDPERAQRGGTAVATPPATPTGTTPIVIPPGLKIPLAGGKVAGSGLPTGTPPKGWTPQYVPGYTPPGGAVPSYVDLSDPTQLAVWKGFQAKGLAPRDQSDFQYWVDHINSTGGMTGDNAKYWTDRMAASQGGVGDYQERPESGSDSLNSLIAPFTEQFTNPAFVAPTSANDQNDPGFTARMNAGQDALQRSAAAKGSLLSGSTLKALSDWNSDYASKEYADTYNRDLSTYNTNSQNAFQQYAQRRANFYQNQDSPFAKLFAMAGLDSSNTNAMNNLNLGYASLGASTLTNPAYASYLTGGANAAAAGTVGAGNAYGGLFSNIGNSALLAYLASHPGGH